MILAVVDTNVLVSAMISPAGNEALVLLAVNQGLVVPCFSEEILTEYSGVLRRKKFAFPANLVDALLEMLRQRGRIVRPVPLVPSSVDPGDDKFIACAKAAGAQFLVTGNKRHFPADLVAPTMIVNAAEMLDFITIRM